MHIDDDIENDELKTMFKHELQKGMEKSGENIKRCFNECKERFVEDMKKDIEQFEERLKDSLITLDRTNIDSGFSFNIHSGIDNLALWGSIGDLALLGIANFWNPMGWVELGIAVSVALVGVVKALWNVFNPDCKKSQQKEAVNEKLDENCKKIAESVRDNLEIAKKDIWEKIEKLKANLRPVDNYERMKRQLKEAHERLGYISNDIKTRSMQ
ncbi:apolipoL family protein [Helicobacter pylori]